MLRFRSFFSFPVLFFGVLLFSGCEIINPEEDTPAYLKINKITLNPSRYVNGAPSGSYGSPSAKITDVWLYANGTDLGVYELPAVIPVLAAGDVRIDVRPGIYIDGLKGNRVLYEFYEQQSLTVNMAPGTKTTIDPVVRFNQRLKFPMNVQDEFTGAPGGVSGNGLRLKNQNSVHKLEAVAATGAADTLNFEFAGGYVGLLAENNLPFSGPVTIESIFNGKLPSNGTKVTLEFDYKSSMVFGAGLAVSPATGGLEKEDIGIYVRPGKVWNRIYVDLTTQVNRPEYKGADFRVILKAEPTANPNDFIAIDNVRLLHY